MLSKQYQLITHDAKMTSKIFAELASIGIANVSINNFDHSRIGEFKRLVKINAIKAAKEKADALARAVDQAIGRAIYIQEQGDPDYGYNYNYPQSNIQRRASSPGEMKEIVDVDLEKIKLDYSMLVRFELK